MIAALALALVHAAKRGAKLLTKKGRSAATRAKAWAAWHAYYRHGGEVRHRRTWDVCPVCGVRCVKLPVPAHPSKRDTRAFFLYRIRHWFRAKPGEQFYREPPPFATRAERAVWLVHQQRVRG